MYNCWIKWFKKIALKVEMTFSAIFLNHFKLFEIEMVKLKGILSCLRYRVQKPPRHLHSGLNFN